MSTYVEGGVKQFTRNFALLTILKYMQLRERKLQKRTTAVRPLSPSLREGNQALIPSHGNPPKGGYSLSTGIQKITLFRSELPFCTSHNPHVYVVTKVKILKTNYCGETAMPFPQDGDPSFNSFHNTPERGVLPFLKGVGKITPFRWELPFCTSHNPHVYVVVRAETP